MVGSVIRSHELLALTWTSGNSRQPASHCQAVVCKFPQVMARRTYALPPGLDCRSPRYVPLPALPVDVARLRRFADISGSYLSWWWVQPARRNVLLQASVTIAHRLSSRSHLKGTACPGIPPSKNKSGAAAYRRRAGRPKSGIDGAGLADAGWRQWSEFRVTHVHQKRTPC